jgi:hypothetical protein
MLGPHREEDFPWTFYFNGEVMPKWGACWMLANVAGLLKVDDDLNEYFTEREVFNIYCKIDHVGNAESADPDVFIFAIQEILCLLIGQKKKVFAQLDKHRALEEIYSGLIEAALKMRFLTIDQHRAFWTSGNDADREYLVERMRCSQLPPEDPHFKAPPHFVERQSELCLVKKDQIRQFQRLAQSSKVDLELKLTVNELLGM